MNVKELKAKLAEFPDDMEVIFAYENTLNYEDSPYMVRGINVKKVKTKLTKVLKGWTMIQSRPVKDETATLAVIIE